MDVAKAIDRLATTQTAAPASSTCRRPLRSPSRPNGSSPRAKASEKASGTSASVAVSGARSRPMAGSEMMSSEMSMMVVAAANSTTTSARRGWLESDGGADMATSVRG